MDAPESLQDHDYWKRRHVALAGSSAAVGYRHFSETANLLLYEHVGRSYERLLSELGVSLSGKRVLDAGAGTGIWSAFLARRGARVVAADLSPEALAQARRETAGLPSLACTLGRLGCLRDGAFDLVHSFDVLYHLLDDREWSSAIAHFCRLSRRHIILHEQFRTRPQWAISKHVRIRLLGETRAELGKHGFVEAAMMPTSIVRRAWTYFLIPLAPRPALSLDRWLLARSFAPFWASTSIRAFVRK